MKTVTLGIRWSELFGEHKGDMSDKMRRLRWETWKQLSRDHGRFESIAWWSTPAELCFNCEHCDGDWCRFQSLPCTVNPITTFSNNEIGLACMGVGYRNKQLQFEFI